jgi:ubiquinone biosynthesis monooxygenase Coq6
VQCRVPGNDHLNTQFVLPIQMRSAIERARKRFSSTTAPAALFDIVIVGGGVTGSLLACLLAESAELRGKAIALVESAPPAPLAAACSSRVDLRTYALSPASARCLSKAGVWDAVRATGRAPAFRGMHVWDALGPGRVSFGCVPGEGAGADGEGAGGEGGELGFMVEHSVLAGALWERVGALKAAGRLSVWAGAAAGDGGSPPPPPLRLASLQLPPWHWEARAAAAAAPPPPPLPASPTNGSVPPPPPAGDFAQLALSTGERLSARLVVAADGAASAARAAAGMGVAAVDYEQSAVVATVELGGRGHGGVAWQRFLPLGPLAVLPLWGNLASVVWSTSPWHAAHLQSLSGDDFVGALNAVLGARCSDFAAAAAAPAAAAADGGEPPSPPPLPADPLSLALSVLTRAAEWATSAAARGAPPPPPPVAVARLGATAALPLRLQLAHSYVRPRFALVGDAAHSVHPLAGQGLNLGVADAAALCGALSAACGGEGADPGALAPLRRYEAARAAPNALVAGGLHLLARLFAGRGGGLLGAALPATAHGVLWGAGGALPALRAAGLAAVDAAGSAGPKAVFSAIAQGKN